MEVLYRFDLDETNGQIKIKKITEYEKKKWVIHNGHYYYRYRENGSWKYAYETDLDRFKSGHVYTLDSDIKHARNIILSVIRSRANKAHSEYVRWNEVLSKMEE